ncbi:hypothetical protein M885DRAFT_513693, partial [Pelagophyceae sp. CCMP2097]
MEIVFANTTWESVFGCAIKEAVGHRYGVACKGVDAASSDALVETLRRTGKASAELIYYRFGDASRPFAAQVKAEAVKSPTAPDAAYYTFAIAKLQASPCSVIRAAESPTQRPSSRPLSRPSQSPVGRKQPALRRAPGAARAAFTASLSESPQSPPS